MGADWSLIGGLYPPKKKGVLRSACMAGVCCTRHALVCSTVTCSAWEAPAAAPSVACSCPLQRDAQWAVHCIPPRHTHMHANAHDRVETCISLKSALAHEGGGSLSQGRSLGDVPGGAPACMCDVGVVAAFRLLSSCEWHHAVCLRAHGLEIQLSNCQGLQGHRVE